MRLFLTLTVSLFCLAAPAVAGDLINESFSGAALPKDWTTGGRANSWSIVDGTLQGVCAKEDDHGPAVFAPIQGRDVDASYRVKLDEKGNCLMLIDGESAFGGAAHLLRVQINGGTIALAQDRGTPQSHIEQGKVRAQLAKEGKKPPQPTKEQLADPKFYRTERLGGAPLEAKPGEWMQIDVSLRGNNVTVTVNGKQQLTGKGTVFNVPKSRLVFLVGQGKKVWIDDVRVRTP